MKKSEDTSSSINALPRRFNGWGILLASLALTAFIFLVIGPVIERNAHLEALEDLEDQERLKRGLLMLCNTRANIKHLNEQLEQKNLEERNRVTPMVQTLGCLPQLEPSYRAEYYLWHGEGEQDEVANVVAQGRASIEPAIDALESEKEQVRHRAMSALMALHEQLNEDHRQRIARRLLKFPATVEVRRFAVALGLEELFAEEEPSKTSPQKDSIAPVDDLEDGPAHESALPLLRLQAPSLLRDEVSEDASGDDAIEEDGDLPSSGTLRLRSPELRLPGAPAILYTRPPQAEPSGEDEEVVAEPSAAAIDAAKIVAPVTEEVARPSPQEESLPDEAEVREPTSTRRPDMEAQP